MNLFILFNHFKTIKILYTIVEYFILGFSWSICIILHLPVVWYPQNSNHNTDHSPPCTLLIAVLFKLAKFRQAFLILYIYVCVYVHLYKYNIIYFRRYYQSWPKSCPRSHKVLCTNPLWNHVLRKCLMLCDATRGFRKGRIIINNNNNNNNDASII